MIGATTVGAEPALIQGDALVHLVGDTLSLDGQIIGTSSTGRVVINAVHSATFFGQVDAANSLEVNAGVGANWTTARLLGTIVLADLSGGDITITGGTLTSGGESHILAGHDVNVTGSMSVGSDPVPVRRPVIVTTPRTSTSSPARGKSPSARSWCPKSRS